MVPDILLETGNFYQTFTRKSGQVVKLKEMAVKCTVQMFLHLEVTNTKQWSLILKNSKGTQSKHSFNNISLYILELKKTFRRTSYHMVLPPHSSSFNSDLRFLCVCVVSHVSPVFLRVSCNLDQEKALIEDEWMNHDTSKSLWGSISFSDDQICL